MSSDPLASRPRLGLLASTAMLALVTAVGVPMLVRHLDRAVEKPGARLAGLPPGVVDPEVTGSIGPAARSVVLDPCTGSRLVVRGP